MAPADGGRVPSPVAGMQQITSLGLVLRRPTRLYESALTRVVESHDQVSKELR